MFSVVHVDYIDHNSIIVLVTSVFDGLFTYNYRLYRLQSFKMFKFSYYC